MTVREIIVAIEAEPIQLDLRQALTVANLSGGEVAREVMKVLK